MTGGQGGPGNEPKKPDAILFTKSFEPIVESVAFVAMAIALQRCFRVAVLPEQLAGQGKLDHAASRLETLVEQLLREIKNMPAEGCPEEAEVRGKQLAMRVLQQIADATRKELAARS